MWKFYLKLIFLIINCSVYSQSIENYFKSVIDPTKFNEELIKNNSIRRVEIISTPYDADFEVSHQSIDKYLYVFNETGKVEKIFIYGDTLGEVYFDTVICNKNYYIKSAFILDEQLKTVNYRNYTSYVENDSINHDLAGSVTITETYKREVKITELIRGLPIIVIKINIGFDTIFYKYSYRYFDKEGKEIYLR